jgi:SepF-like predicted cell division protein (DUF552 family)
MDLSLKHKIDSLSQNGVDVSCLLLLEYKLFKDGKFQELEPNSKLNFLEKNRKLRVINRNIKRKKLIRSLEEYTTINIYKNCRSLLLLSDEISKKCKNYSVTISDEVIDADASFLKKKLYNKLFSDAKYLIFNSQQKQNKFEKNFDFDEKTLLLLDAIPLIDVIDKITPNEKEAFIHKLSIKDKNDIVYCDMSGSIDKQIQLIANITNLSKNRLKKSTFIFPMLQNDFQNRKQIKTYLENKDFDFILIDGLMNDFQKAMLFQISNRAIILSKDDNNPALELALYSKCHVYLFDISSLDDYFTKNSLFVDKFEEFLDEHEKSETQKKILEELFKKNKHIIKTLFSSKKSIEQLQLVFT